MTTSIATLTYNRLGALQTHLAGVLAHRHKNGPVAIFEDCGQADGTRAWLKSMATDVKPRPHLLATQHSTQPFTAFLGTENLGVAGNSNRAIRWFMEETESDHLLLCNDDLTIQGDVSTLYAKAHQETGVGLFCFCDFTSQQFKTVPLTYRGVALKKLTRMTGIMMSLTRKLVEDIGYFDPQFGQFGEDHCDYTVRARYAGHQNIHGLQQYALDVEQPKPPTVVHMEVPSCIHASQKPDLDRVASMVMGEKSKRYPFTDGYLPYSLIRHHLVDAINDVGIENDAMIGHCSLL